MAEANVKIERIAANETAKQVRISLPLTYGAMKEASEFEPDALLVKNEDKEVIFKVKLVDKGTPMVSQGRVDIVKPARKNDNISFLVDGSVSNAVLVRIQTRLTQVVEAVTNVTSEISGANIPTC